VSLYFIPPSLINLISGHISKMYCFSGPNRAVVRACSTGVHAWLGNEDYDYGSYSRRVQLPFVVLDVLLSSAIRKRMII